MISAHEHDEIVNLFYAASADGKSWRSALDRTASLFGSRSTLLGIHDRRFLGVLSMESHNYSQDFLAGFFQGEIFANDPRLAHMDRIPAGSIYYDEMLYDVREMEQDPWVKASIDQLGVFDQIGAKFRIPGDRFVSFGLLRTRKEGRVSREAVRAFERLVPPLERACALGYLLEEQVGTCAVLLDILASKNEAVILLGRSGDIRFLNDAARRLLHANDGLALRDGALVAARPPEARRLGRLIAEVLADFGCEGRVSGGRMLVSRRSRKRPYVVNVTAAPPQDAFLGGAGMSCVIRIEDLGRRIRPPSGTLQSLFGLTRREAELAVELVDSTRLDQAAARCDMAVNTARNHLQSIFGKTGTGSQAELVQLFSRLW